MKVLIKQAHIISPSSPFNGQTKDIFINDGIISKIADAIREKADHTIDQKGLYVSISWVDIFANFAELGYEYRESMESGAKAAAAEVLRMPPGPSVPTQMINLCIVTRWDHLCVLVLPVCNLLHDIAKVRIL